MVFSAAVKRALHGALLLAALLVALPARAQESPSESEAVTVLVSTGVGELALAGRTLSLPWGETPQGALVALSPVVGRLGGRLEVGPLGQSWTVFVGDQSFLLSPGSAAATSGTDILPLSQPTVERDGELYVPLDLLERLFGSTLGVRFRWDPASHRLAAERPESREIPVEVDLVHLQGLSTLVFRFPERPRYTLRQEGTEFEIAMIGDRVVPPVTPPRGGDPLVRSIDIQPARIRVELEPGSAAETYTLTNPFRIVFDAYREPTSVAAPSGTEALAARAQRPPGVRMVVIDPGHGGSETGATGPSGTAEKELTLLISRSLAARLREELGVQAVLTREEDVDLGLDERSALANQYRADLFVSVHLNSTVRGGARGAETYFLSLQASDQRAADAAAVENYVGEGAAAPGSDEFDLQLLLWDLAQSQHLAASQRLATMIQEELNHQLDLRDRGVKQAPFRVLMGAAMPAVLVELGFISSREEEAQLRDPDYRAQLVEAVVRAIARFKAAREGGVGGDGRSTEAPG